VHESLGRHRTDSGRNGWISGLGEAEGREHPTRGGLRIGKPLPERRADEPYDQGFEWPRDGQYFHYLTRWMHALACMARATNECRYLEWAVDLAEVAHGAFTYVDPEDGRRRMRWKMSINLARPLVATMGHHDPLDGMLTCVELQAALACFPVPHAAASIDAILDDYRTIAGMTDWGTEDPLGLGGLLAGAYALARAMSRGPTCAGCSVTQLLDCAAAHVVRLHHRFPFGRDGHSLAFRELGLAIGLQAVPRLTALAERDGARLGGTELDDVLDRLAHHVTMATMIEAYWLSPANREAPSWLAHQDINDVMLATSLVPDGYLEA
jgi:hypothetical protein